jgi:hypothetical protein
MKEASPLRLTLPKKFKLNYFCNVSLPDSVVQWGYVLNYIEELPTEQARLVACLWAIKSKRSAIWVLIINNRCGGLNIVGRMAFPSEV